MSDDTGLSAETGLTLCDWYIDADGDGYGSEADIVQADCDQALGGYVQVTDGVLDCDDAEGAIYPGAEELCDGLDNDCDGDTDEEALSTGYQDIDGDGYGNDDEMYTGCDLPDGYVDDAGDCDDTSASIYPGAPTECTDGDMNCDGIADNIDGDSDGYAGCAVEGELGDCDDTDSAINPDADELCDDIDNDCDASIDEEPADGEPFYMDADEDTYGDPDASEIACEAPDGYVADSSDCSDSNAAIYPGADEYCDDIDNDCDDSTDEEGAVDASTWYVDGDGDGYGDASATTEACNQPEGYAATSDDCDDSDSGYNPGADESDCADPNDYNCDGVTGYVDADGDGYAACEECDDSDAAINPDADEVCDLTDNDCDGELDEGDAIDAPTWYADVDNDTYGDADVTTTNCGRPSGYVEDTTDCDDSVASTHPGAPETCDEADNDCDDVIDEDAVDTDTFYADTDSDGYGDSSSTQEACDLPSGYAEVALDCDDTSAAVNPDADEYCDELDNDCDGLTDENDALDVETWYSDVDGDGYGGSTETVESCSLPSGYADNAEDCNDLRSDQNPAEDELCDLVDNDCDDVVDEDGAVDASTWYADDDGDTYGDADDTYVSCERPDGYVADATDCDDDEYAVNPGRSEVCDSLDNDCDDSTDEDAADDATWYGDSDGDGYGDVSDTQLACDQPSDYVSNDQDCDDTDAAVNPEATEVCDDGDNDCDGTVDEDGAKDASTWYADSDGDNYGDKSSTQEACEEPSGYTSTSGDCDDSNPNINPNANELCDSDDNDCDGTVDEEADDATNWYPDLDGDGYGESGAAELSCDTLSGYVTDGTDCDDDYGGSYPGAEELCDDLDNDCDDAVDEGSSVCEICPLYVDPSTSYSGDGSESSPFASINDAIKGHGDCDEIALQPGTYYENVDFAGNDLYVYSTGGAEKTIIDAGGSGSAISFTSGETVNAILEGVTLTNGSGTSGASYSALESSQQHGGGVFIYESDPTITDCIIELNEVDGQGGGVLAYDWDGYLIYSEINNNDSAVENYSGGGIALIESDGAIGFNEIYDNMASGSSGDGAGLYAYDSQTEIGYNWFESNDANGTGEAMRSRNSTLWFFNNVVIDHDGYALALSDTDNSYVLNNTVEDNKHGLYVGVNLGSDPTATIINNQFTNASTYGVYLASDSGLNWGYNNIWGSGSVNYVYSSWTWYGWYYDDQSDPQYVDPSSDDYHLDSGSPHKDAGYDLTGTLDDDYEGTARPQGSGYSIGAYEE